MLGSSTTEKKNVKILYQTYCETVQEWMRLIT